jgi:hypothetical protein
MTFRGEMAEWRATSGYGIRDARYGMWDAREKQDGGDALGMLNVELSGLGRRTTVRYPKFEVSGTRNPATPISHPVSRIPYLVSHVPLFPSASNSELRT